MQLGNTSEMVSQLPVFRLFRTNRLSVPLDPTIKAI